MTLTTPATKRRRILVVLAAAAVLVPLAVAIIGVMLVARVRRLASPPAPPDRPKLVWDLSGEPNVSAVGWPGANGDTAWFLEGPQPVSIKLPDGRQVDHTFAKVHVRRAGTRITSIVAYLPPEPLDAACARAKRMLAEWGIKDDGTLDAWRVRRIKDPSGDRDPKGRKWGLGKTQHGWSGGVGIAWTFADTDPWAVIWSWGPEDE